MRQGMELPEGASGRVGHLETFRLFEGLQKQLVVSSEKLKKK
jgi:hypothetical protein